MDVLQDAVNEGLPKVQLRLGMGEKLRAVWGSGDAVVEPDESQGPSFTSGKVTVLSRTGDTLATAEKVTLEPGLVRSLSEFARKGQGFVCLEVPNAEDVQVEEGAESHLFTGKGGDVYLGMGG